MDAVMPLSPESLQNRQALTAIAHIRQFLPDARILVASKARPDWLPATCAWVESPDRYANSDANQIDAIFAAIRAGLTRRFLRCSDDETLIDADPQPLDAGPILTRPGGRWQRRLNRTATWLLQQGFPTLNYDTHTPKIYDAAAFVRIFSGAPYQGHAGLTIESTYFNQALHATAHC